MSEAVTVALIGLGGSCLGSLFGMLCASKVNSYRLSELEKKVDKHNDIIERIYMIEQEQAVIRNRLTVADHRLNRLEAVDRREQACSQS